MINKKNRRNLTSLEYAGLESLLQRIITEYEENLGIPSEEQTPVNAITRRSARSIEIFDGAYDAYILDGFAIKAISYKNSICELQGFCLNGRDIEDCEEEEYILIDITSMLEEEYIDLDWLMEQIENEKKGNR